MKTSATTPRRRNPFLHQEDFDILYHGARGMSTKFIQARTDMTACQVAYLLRKEGVRRTDYRNGTSAFSRQMERLGKQVFETSVLRPLASKYKRLK